MSKVIYIVELSEVNETADSYSVYSVRCFLSREAAEKYVNNIHPSATTGFTHICPSEGVETYRVYWIDPIVLEEE